MSDYIYPEVWETWHEEEVEHQGSFWEDVAVDVGDAFDSVGNELDDAWSWINDRIDEYIWATGTDEAIVEGFVRDILNIEDAEGLNFFEEASNKVEEVVTTYVWDASEHEAWLERQVNSMMDDWLGRGEKLIDDVTNAVDEVVDEVVTGGGGAVKTVYEVVERTIETQLGDVKIDLDFGLGWIAERIEDIMAIPAKLMFSMFVEFFFEEVE